MTQGKLDFGQLYGYAVCLVSVITFLFGAGRMVTAILDIRELSFAPSYTNNGPSLVSLEAYRIDLLHRIGAEHGSGAAAALIPPDDSTLRHMFEAERLHRLGLSFQTSRRAIVVNLVLLVLAGLLFAFHWTWLRKRERIAASQS